MHPIVILSITLFHLPFVQEKSETKNWLTSRGYQAIQLDKLATGHETIQAKLNGRSGRFIVDTGAGTTVIHVAHRKKYKVTGKAVRSETAAGVGGEFRVSYFPIKTIQLGQAEIQLKEIATANLGGILSALGSRAGYQIDGIIGQDALAKVAGILNVGEQTLFTRKPVNISGAESVGNDRLHYEFEKHLVSQNYHSHELQHLNTGHFTIPTVINGKDGTFVLDSGARASCIHRPRLQQFNLSKDNQVGNVIAGGGAGGGTFSREYALQSIQIGKQDVKLSRITATDLTAVVKELTARNNVSVDGVIGQDILVTHEAIVDIAANRLYLLKTVEN